MSSALPRTWRKDTYTHRLLPRKKHAHLSSGNANHHLVLGMGRGGKGFPRDQGLAVRGCRCSRQCLVPPRRIVPATLQGCGVVSDSCSKIGARDPGGHQGYHRLQEERSGSACPNQDGSEGSGVSPCPWAVYSPLFLQQHHLQPQEAARPAFWAALNLPPTAEVLLGANANSTNPRRARPVRAEPPSALTVLGRSSSAGQPCRAQKEETSAVALLRC